MLDLGAGDGRVTSVLAQFYKNVAVTEASKVNRFPFNFFSDSNIYMLSSCASKSVTFSFQT